MTLLLVLLAVPLHAHRRVAEAFRVAAAIRLPDAERISAGAVVAVRRAVERDGALRPRRGVCRRHRRGRPLGPRLPALARGRSARLRRRRSSPTRCSIGGGGLRSRFSLIPEADAAERGRQPGVRIERIASPSCSSRDALERPASRGAARSVVGRRLAELGSAASAARGLPAARRSATRRPRARRRGPSWSSTGRTARRREEGPDVVGRDLRVGSDARAGPCACGCDIAAKSSAERFAPGPTGSSSSRFRARTSCRRLLTAALLLPRRGRALSARRR